MHENFERSLGYVLTWEGGYSNQPDDPGGPTMRGIIQREYDSYRERHGLLRQPVRYISSAEIRDIYTHEYWDAMGCDALPAGLDYCVFDAAVNSGVARAKAWLGHAKTVDEFCNARLAFVSGLGHLWAVFGAGWARRIAFVRQAASAMARGDTPHDAEWAAQTLYFIGVVPEPLSPGLDGPAEAEALKRFQGAHGLQVDGIAGPHTVAALEQALGDIAHGGPIANTGAKAAAT